LITSQFEPECWHELIRDSTVADAILDRLIHNAHRIKLGGESIRKNQGMKKGSLPPSRQAD
jgi:DNA replication protein DnaC